MKLLNIVLFVFFLLAASVAGAPAACPCVRRSVVPSAHPDDTRSDLDELPTLPGFGSMTHPNNSTAANKYALDSSGGMSLDGGVCRYVEITGKGKIGQTGMRAKCHDEKGIWWDTTMNLNDCVANDGGTLIFYEGGNFDDFCRRCEITDPGDGFGLDLKCKCVNKAGEKVYALLPLGSHIPHPLAIKPVDGRLTCGDHLGNMVPSFYG